MNNRLFVSTPLFFAALPATVYGGVVVNEVAWMGTMNSAQDEWIEITGPAGTNLDGWKLFTEDGGASITLSGAIGSSGYFLIERTDDTTVPDVVADLVTAFGSGLGNTGDIIILQNGSGEEIDRVDGSNNWTIGGNNTTKETLQRTLSGWITAPATPRRENNAPSAAVQEPNNNENNAPANGDSNATPDLPSSAYSAPIIEQKLRVYAGKDQTVLVGALVAFEGYAQDQEGNALDGARFLWNFGDGSTGEGKTIRHTYFYPGMYRVFVDASVGIYSTSAALNITVTPNLLGISELKPGAWLELINGSSRTVDISGFGIRINNGKPFYFPRNSFVSAQSRFVLDEKLLGFAVPRGGTFQILYPNGSVFLSIVYPPEILTEGESLVLTPGGWEKGVATPGETNKLIGVPETASPKPALQEVTQPKAQDKVLKLQQITQASSSLAQHRASGSVDSMPKAPLLSDAAHREASIFDSIGAISGGMLLAVGLVVSVFASVAAFFLRRFFS